MSRDEMAIRKPDQRDGSLLARMSPRYPSESLACFSCGGDCADGYEERHESASDGSYSETVYYCNACLNEQGRGGSAA